MMTERSQSVRNALRLLGEPIPREKKRLMRERWEALDPRWRFPGQGLGQKATGCGATIGVHPRCDFDCTGCYLGSEANDMVPIGIDAARRELDRLRAWLGPKGNVQITDGEVTLLPADELVSILQHARAIGLIPMVMSHGDSFRRKPGLLDRLVLEGGLTEISIHVDVTQRGRLGYKKAASERELTPLREEFAEMVRETRRSTNRPLRTAMTLTITGENIDEVPHVVEWCFRNRDVFAMLSFQPIAQVGRTRKDLPGVTVAELWERIWTVFANLGLPRASPAPLVFGHPQCSRIEAVGVYERSGHPPRVFPIVRKDHPEDFEVMREFLARGLGGINFRDDSALERVCRTAGVFLTDPGWFLGPVLSWVGQRLAALGTSLPRLAFDAARGRVKIGGFSVVSHHFMSPGELATDLGRERLAACVFRVPVNGEMVSMCRVNAGGVREAFYAQEPLLPMLPRVLPVFAASAMSAMSAASATSATSASRGSEQVAGSSACVSSARRVS